MQQLHIQVTGLHSEQDSTKHSAGLKDEGASATLLSGYQRECQADQEFEVPLNLHAGQGHATVSKSLAE